ncbi:Holliday junction resolvase RuvX [candidate division KSB1 bacterium]|nr:Holliday junction resolvase RuvX [candidate division KSB1 bacterium]
MITGDVLKRIPLGRILAIDFGQKRIGLAISDPSQILASPLCTLHRKGVNIPFDEISRMASEQQAVVIVVGNPLHMNGTRGEKAKEVAAFIENLFKHTELAIIPYDERWTTVSAEKSLKDRGKRPSRSRSQVDQIAAAFLLQSFLNRLAMHRCRSS